MSEIDRLYRYKTLLSHRRALAREDILAALESGTDPVGFIHSYV